MKNEELRVMNDGTKMIWGHDNLKHPSPFSQVVGNYQGRKNNFHRSFYNIFVLTAISRAISPLIKGAGGICPEAWRRTVG
jgi:hypothetical protein